MFASVLIRTGELKPLRTLSSTKETSQANSFVSLAVHVFSVSGLVSQLQTAINSVLEGAKTSHPCSVTRTMSSIRTPHLPGR